jgi:nucleotide-binding universal stress UspA family protein
MSVSTELSQPILVAVFGHNDLDHVVALGPIERVLDDHSHDAAMIVVGTRATDSWLARLRGSVTNRLTGQVACPVVSVPLEEPAVAAA